MNFEKFKAHFNEHDIYCKNSGVRLAELSEGYAKVELIPDEKNMNFLGIMHGGMLFSMADIAAGTAAMSYGSQAVTLNANIEFINPVKRGKVIAEGRVINKGRTIIRCEVVIHSEDNTLYSKASVTMYATNKYISYRLTD